MSISNSFNRALSQIQKHYERGETGLPQDASIQVVFQKTLKKEDYDLLPPEQKEALDKLYSTVSQVSCSKHPEYVKALSAYKNLRVSFTPLKPSFTTASSAPFPDKTLESWGKDSASEGEKIAHKRITGLFKEIQTLDEGVNVLLLLDLSNLGLTTLPSSFFTDPKLEYIQLNLEGNPLSHYPDELVVGSVKNMDLYEEVNEIISEHSSLHSGEGVTDEESSDGSTLGTPEDLAQKEEDLFYLQAADAFEYEIQAQELGLHVWETSGDKETAVQAIVTCFQTKSSSLSLDGLGLSSLPPDLFMHLPHLQEFFCSNNALTVLHLRGASNLKAVVMNNNRIEHLSLEEAPSLELLSIHHNRISSLDLTHQSRLQSLTASNNALGSLDLTNQTKLIYLDLSYNTFFTIDVSSLTHLRDLQISSNFLESIDLTGLIHLTHLNLSKNRIASLDLTGSDHPKELSRLNVSHNRLHSLDLISRIELVDLDISHNRFEDFNAQGLHGLIRLNFSHNELFLIENLSDLRNLIDLDLSDNRFLQIDLTGLTQLRTLNMRSNYLRERPNLEVCPRLTKEIFDQNPFSPKKLQYKKTSG